MRIAVVHNLEDPQVLRHLGTPNPERIHERTVQGVAEGLREAGHHVVLLEGDGSLASHLAVLLQEAQGAREEVLAFNIAYGVQGRDRYTQVPALLEMLGVPYVGSAPSAHSLALDKSHTKSLLHSAGVPTPPSQVVHTPEQESPDLGYPVIVKPKAEAGSIGLRVCDDEEELRAALHELISRFRQPMLVERYVEGRELYVALLGNGEQVEAFPPVELVFGEGEHVVRRRDKDAAHDGRPGRDLRLECPARLSPAQTAEAQRLAKAAFAAVGCEDLARIDMRLGEDGALWVLEINSIPGLDPDGPYAISAYERGYTFPQLLDAIVVAARRRYRNDRRVGLVPRREAP